jgi:hypothetical protein
LVKHKLNLYDGATLTNYNIFKASSLIIDGTETSYFRNLTSKAQATFSDIFNEVSVTIDNQGSLELPAFSTVGSYTGNNTSELILTLPANNLNKPLINVVNEASFTQGAKIILAANPKACFLSTKEQLITIVQAATLTYNNNADELLFSRVYGNNQAVKFSQPSLVANSVFIKVTDAKIANNKLSAKLSIDIANVGLTAGKDTLAKSLLKNYLISSGKWDRKIKTVLQANTEHQKSVDSQLNIAGDIIGGFDTQPATKKFNTGFNFAATKYNNYNLSTRIAFYAGKNSQDNYNWKDMLLCTSGELITTKINVGASLAYINSKLDINKKTTTKNSYLAIAKATNYFNDLRIDYGMIYGIVTSNQYQNQHATEFSAVAISSYNFAVNKVNLTLAINSMFINISNPSYTDKTTTQLVEKNSKNFLAIGTLLTAYTNYQLQGRYQLTAAVESGYNYTKMLSNLDEIAALTKHDNNKHRIHIKTKVHIDYRNWFSAASIAFNHNGNNNGYGLNLVLGYRL